MSSVHPITNLDKETTPVSVVAAPSPWIIWAYLVVGAVLLAVVGTWLVWFSVSVQRQFQQEDIRAACQRVMPETADRCYDTVVIQRGGVRR